MQTLLLLLGLYFFLSLVVFPIWVLVKFSDLGHRVDSLLHRYEELKALRPRYDDLKAAVDALHARLALATAGAAAPVPVSGPARPTGGEEPAPAREFVPVETPAAAVLAPPRPAELASAVPPPLLARPVYAPPPRPAGWMESVNWEQFMGAKLFAWLGGLALFLGVAFFVKYSFDHGWIPPEARVAMGFVFGAGLVVGGLRLDRSRYDITAQTLIATGIVSLYAVTFACNSVYHFAFFGQVPTFLVMALITSAAFVLAVRLQAQVIALLGMLGGFLTPWLLATGVDNPAGLFGYLALLDVGLVAVALRRRWPHLVPLGAGGTALMMAGWAGEFFTAEKGGVAMTIALGFSALYLLATEIARHRRAENREWFAWTAAGMAFVGAGFALYFLGFPIFAARAPLYLGYVLALDLVLLRLAWREESVAKLHPIAGLVTFFLLACWTAGPLTEALLPWALAGYLGFAILHTAFPHLLQRARPDAGAGGWSQVFPPLALVLVLLPIVRLDTVSFLVWPVILLVDILAIGLALVSASLAAVGAALVLTLIATGLALFNVAPSTALEPSLLLVIGGFGVFFFVATGWLVRRLGDRLPPAKAGGVDFLFGDQRAQLPALSALLPFLLLIMASLRLAVPDPSMLFGLGLLLVLLTLGLACLLDLEWLSLPALAGMGALEFAWHSRHFNPQAATGPLLWYLGFYALFALFPIVLRRRSTRLTGPWTVAALSGLVHFPLVYQLVKQAMPNDVMGLLPAAFAVTPLLSLAMVVRTASADEPRRLNQLAWLGGVGLLFITLVFPIQFDRQWLTVAWALEGAALLWLFRRVPHAGLRLVGVGLLATAFVRLTFNAAVFSYHVRGEVPILNWYLYAYGLVIAALFAGARLLAPPRESVLGFNAPRWLTALGVVLAFLLLNIEIADFFTRPGATTLTFRFSGHFGRDMTYTIAWSLFALGLLIAGIWRQQRAVRYAAIGLLSVALAKLFLHDLARLEALYRVGALFAVAVIAIVASVAYQRFLPRHEKSAPPAP